MTPATQNDRQDIGGGWYAELKRHNYGEELQITNKDYSKSFILQQQSIDKMREIFARV